MNGVIGVAELLERTELTEQQAEYVTLIQKSADTLLGLINNILDFSKIEADRLELEATPFPLRDTLGDTLQTLSLHAADKGLELAVHIPPEVPDRVVGDPVRLRQVVVNLVGNAIKFTERGEVVVDLHLVERGAQRMRLGVEVRDTGIGIPADKRRKIFEAFGQADSSTTRQSGGTGLGLSIAAQLVKMMGGRIEVRPAPGGQGSRFVFDVDLGLPEEGDAAPASSPGLQGLAVLVVDDNATNRRILDEILAGWGMRPLCVASGREALAAISRAERAGEPFPLALLDMMMPQMDGLVLAERIRAHPSHAAMPILMLSSGGRAGDVQRRRRLGITRRLLKPLKPSELLDAIGEALGRRRPAAREGAPASRVTATPRRVLLVEDGRINQQVACDLLRQRGHGVVLAEDGREAVEAVEREAFDVVLMDIHMPVMDGLEASRTIRDAGYRLPIVAMTASATREDRDRCLAAGMNDFVSKPFRAAELYAVVERDEEGAPRDAASSAQISAAVASGVEGDDREDGPTPCLDRAAALEALDGHREMLAEMVEMFRDEGPRLLAAIDAALAAGQARELRRAAHTLKGSARVVGGLAVGEAARRLEALARAGELDQAASARDGLAHRLEALLAALAAADRDDEA